MTTPRNQPQKPAPETISLMMEVRSDPDPERTWLEPFVNRAVELVRIRRQDRTQERRPLIEFAQDPGRRARVPQVENVDGRTEPSVGAGDLAVEANVERVPVAIAA